MDELPLQSLKTQLDNLQSKLNHIKRKLSYFEEKIIILEQQLNAHIHDEYLTKKRYKSLLDYHKKYLKDHSLSRDERLSN